jgi:hypothetical protein
MPSKLLFTAGAKGGKGKSTAARFLATYLREHGQPLFSCPGIISHSICSLFSTLNTPYR